MDLGVWWFMMPPKGRKHCQSLLPDILSNLPDNAIDVILMRLPYKDVVRTSVLSKKWRNRWRRVIELKFDGSLWETKEDNLYPTIKFTNIICPLLKLHEGPITKFTLDIAHLYSCPLIDFFIYFLSRNHIQHLVLHFPFGQRYKLRSLLFTCSQLRHLNLHRCSMHHPSGFQGFDKLISLELRDVTISSELLNRLISHCPMLEQLVLKSSEKLDTIEISAPMLRSFYFIGDLSSICLKNVPRLVKVTLLGDIMQAEDLDLTKLFESCSALEHLSFDFCDDGFFSEEGYEAPTRLPFNLNSVKRLYLPNILLVESYKLSYTLCLLRSFPYLEYLEITVYIEDEYDSDAEESVEFECLLDVTLNHLREVKLVDFSGRMCEMRFVKLLLANSPVLERMLIDRGLLLDLESLDTRLIFAEVSNFSRSSPKAEIVYIDLSDHDP